jgi:hypothetical protein
MYQWYSGTVGHSTKLYPNIFFTNLLLLQWENTTSGFPNLSAQFLNISSKKEGLIYNYKSINLPLHTYFNHSPIRSPYLYFLNCIFLGLRPLLFTHGLGAQLSRNPLWHWKQHWCRDRRHSRVNIRSLLLTATFLLAA